MVNPVDGRWFKSYCRNHFDTLIRVIPKVWAMDLGHDHTFMDKKITCEMYKNNLGRKYLDVNVSCKDLSIGIIRFPE